MCSPWRGLLEENLTTDWNIQEWTEAQPFSEFADAVTKVDVLVSGRLRGDWPALPNLKFWHVPFTGVDFITPKDLPKGCLVCNTYEHEIPMAEYVLASMLEWEIKLFRLASRFKEFGWEGWSPGNAPTHGELFGKTLGIIGHGHIGREAAVRARAFGMRVTAVSRSARPCPPELDSYATMDGLPNLLAESDYVLVTLPLAPETRGAFAAEQFAQMKKTGVIINVGRGKTVDEEALYQAVSQKRIGGAIIDVWYVYPSPDDPDPKPSKFPFESLDNVLMTPHSSALTEETRVRRWKAVARNLNLYARGQPVENVFFEGTA